MRAMDIWDNSFRGKVRHNLTRNIRPDVFKEAIQFINVIN